MRSVVVLLRDATELAVTQYLNNVYPSQREPWVAFVGDDPCLYINFLQGSPFDDEEVAEMTARFGGQPEVVVIADVSGRHPGDGEVRDFVSGLLHRFSGAVMDDYTDHLWTLAELHGGHLVSGHPFFDYQGWYEQGRCSDA